MRLLFFVRAAEGAWSTLGACSKENSLRGRLFHLMAAEGFIAALRMTRPLRGATAPKATARGNCEGDG
jgi:hypothetical protein